MFRFVMVLLFSSFFILNACMSIESGVNHKTEVEETINIEDLPSAVLLALPKEYNTKEFTYQRKFKDDVVSYEVHYKKDKDKLSITYDEQGKILEKEKKIEFSDLPNDLRTKVDQVLSKHYPNYSIILVEEVYTHNEKLLEVFFFHSKAKTGFVEAIFEYQTGVFREFVNIRMKSIQTLY